MKKGTKLKSKREIKDQSFYENNLGLLTDTEIDKKLSIKAKKCIYDAISKYENGPYASIFNEADMIALAQDVQMEVKRRVLLYQENPQNTEAVNSRGMGNYYQKAFSNHLQKIYEKYAKTDTRAGVGTISSDEALTLASSKNLIYPEDHYVIMKEFEHVVSLLEKKDNEYNEKLKTKYKQLNKEIPERELSVNSIIIEKILEGSSPSDIRDFLKLSKSDYAHKRDNALIHAKECFAANYNDLKEHFDQTLDQRIYTRDVNKRLKKETRLKNDFDLRKSFFVENKIDKITGTIVANLKIKIDFIQQDRVSKDITSQMFILKSESHKFKDLEKLNEINSNLLELKSSNEIISLVDDIIKNIRTNLKIKISA